MKYSERTRRSTTSGRDPASDPSRDAAAPLAGQLRSRSPRSPTCPPAPAWAPRASYTVCLLKALAHARHTSITPSWPRRGSVPHRDRRARRAGRQAGPVRRRPRRDLRLHVPPRRPRSRSSPSSSSPDTLRCSASACSSSTRARRARPRPILADQDTRSQGGRPGDARKPPSHQGDGLRQPGAAREG